MVARLPPKARNGTEWKGAPWARASRPSLGRRTEQGSGKDGPASPPPKPCPPSQGAESSSLASRPAQGRPGPDQPFGQGAEPFKASRPAGGNSQEMVGQKLAGRRVPTGSAQKQAVRPGQHQAPAAEGVRAARDGGQSIRARGSNQ